MSIVTLGTIAGLVMKEDEKRKKKKQAKKQGQKKQQGLRW